MASRPKPVLVRGQSSSCAAGVWSDHRPEDADALEAVLSGCSSIEMVIVPASAEEVATAEPMPTAEPTASPTPEPELSLGPGTHKVGTDIEPGVYAGKAGIDVSDWCSWKRLSGVTGDSDDVIAIEIEQGQFYVEILPTDKYFNVACEITPLADWPIPDEHPTKIEQGTYLIGRDISPGTYAGKAGIDVSDWCSWKRLSGVTGDSDDVIAIEIEQGQFYVTIEATDYAFTTGCELTLSE